MVGRRAVRWLTLVALGAFALGAMLSLAVVAAPIARACWGPGIPIERVVAHPGTIGLVRVLDVARNPQARYRFAVDEVWRGTLRPVLDESGGPETSQDAGVPLVVALLAIASGVLGAAVLVAALARRRHRDERD
jgi:hypothetical protein